MNDNLSAFNSNEYDEKIKKTLPFYETIYKQVMDVVKAYFDKSLKWLDVGCGTGKMAETAFESTDISKFVFSDSSAQMIKEVRNRYSRNSEFICTTAEKLQCDEKFDVVTAIQVFHYLNEEERKASIENCYRLLDNGGVFITFENFSPYSEVGRELFLKRWKSYQLSQGKTEEESDKHISRYGKGYFPITISQHLDVLHSCGFNTAEIFWVSNMQVGLMGIKNG